jgi:tetratricopeptide (TPR) repeat protein
MTSPPPPVVPSPVLPTAGQRVLLGAVLALAAGLRLAHWWVVRDAPFVAWPVMDSLEYHRWASRLVAGDAGAGAFFQAPLYPYLLAALYTPFGPRPAVGYLFQSALAVVAVYALYRAGRELGGPTLGLAAAALVAACGILVFHDVQLLKESLAASLVAVLLWTLLAAQRTGAASRWALGGLLLGLLAGLRENALLLLPLLLALPWLSRGGAPANGAPASRAPASRAAAGRAAAASALLLAGTLVALLPWAVRNRLVAGETLLTTYQGGVNFYIGNNPDADGTYRPLVPGKQVPALERSEPVRLAEAATGRRLSAAEVSRYWWRQSLAWAVREPMAFLALQGRKLALFWRFYEQPDAVDYYWLRQLSPPLRLAFVELGALCLLAAAGLWLVRGELRRWTPVLLLIAGWTAATVAFFVFSRYRLPVIPALALLAGVPLARLGPLVRAGRWGAATAGGLGIAAALLVPHLFGFAPRLDLVHYNLGRLAEERDDPAAAAAHYRVALDANPGEFLPLMNLGNLAARGGDLAAARDLYRRAVALEPASDDAWANLGGAHLGLGELDAAAAALERALALNPQHLQALHNRALLAERQGDLAAARRWNRRALAVAPAHPQARRQAERLGEGPAGP